MTSKFARNFWLITLFAIVAANSFGVEPTKRFGCHNFSSVNKIVDMENNTNELLRNLKQCMRDTNTYNEENLGTAKKFQNDFELAQKNTWGDIFKGEILELGFGIPVIVGSVLFFGTLFSKHKRECVVGSMASWAIAYKTRGIADHHWCDAYYHRTNRKEAVAIHIKNFVDTLQKKNRK